MLVVYFQQSVYRLLYASLLERCHWRIVTCLHHHLDAVFFRLHPTNDLPTHDHDLRRLHSHSYSTAYLSLFAISQVEIGRHACLQGFHHIREQ